MSKTYKTDPSWVKALRKDSTEIKEYHDHTKKDEDGNIICDIDSVEKPDVFYWQRVNASCGYTVSYYGWHNGFYGRGSASWLKSEVKLRHGAARANLRKDAKAMLKSFREDIEDYDIINPRHRNGALWDWH